MDASYTPDGICSRRLVRSVAVQHFHHVQAGDLRAQGLNLAGLIAERDALMAGDVT